MHDVGVALDPHELVDPDGAGRQTRPRSLRARSTSMTCSARSFSSAWSSTSRARSASGRRRAGGAGDRPHGGSAALDGDQHLLGGAGDGDAGEAQEVHVGGGLTTRMDPVDVERVGAGRHGEPLGRDHLEDVAGADVLQGLADHLLVAAGGEVAAAVAVGRPSGSGVGVEATGTDSRAARASIRRTASA